MLLPESGGLPPSVKRGLNDLQKFCGRTHVTLHRGLDRSFVCLIELPPCHPSEWALAFCRRIIIFDVAHCEVKRFPLLAHRIAFVTNILNLWPTLKTFLDCLFNEQNVLPKRLNFFNPMLVLYKGQGSIFIHSYNTLNTEKSPINVAFSYFMLHGLMLSSYCCVLPSQ